jgi:O-antigen/teichoic acid export membrane protein
MSPLQRLRNRLRTDGRLARIVHGGASGLLAKGLNLLVSAVSVPLTFRYLGTLEYGIWITISTTVVMLSVLDIGIANTLTNFISEAYADDDQERAQHYFATAFWITIGIAGTLGLLCAACWSRLNWAGIFHLAAPLEIEHARLAVAISVAYFLTSLPLNLANKVITGYQQVHQANYFAMMNSVFALVAIVIAIHLHGTLVHLMAAYCAAMLFGTLALNLWLCLWAKPWLLPAPRMIRRQLVRTLFGEGVLFFVLQLTGIVVYNSDNLVITHYLGPDRVTPYSIAWKLVSSASLLHVIMIPSLWAAFSGAYHKRELGWMQETYRSMRRRTLSAVAAAAVCWALVGRWLIRLWAGPDAVPSGRLLWLMALYIVLNCATTNQAMLLTATRRLKLEAAVAVLAAVVNLALTVHWVRSMGPEGVMLGTLTSFATCMVLPQAWEVRRVLRGVYLRPAEAAYTPTNPQVS